MLVICCVRVGRLEVIGFAAHQPLGIRIKVPMRDGKVMADGRRQLIDVPVDIPAVLVRDGDGIARPALRVDDPTDANYLPGFQAVRAA